MNSEVVLLPAPSSANLSVPSSAPQRFRLCIMGPPGAGKGTQGMRLAKYASVPHIATGDLLRRIVVNENSELADAARVINEGKMVSDAVASALVFRELHDSEGFVLDGYPRNVAQADILKARLEERGQTLTCVLYLEVDEDELLRRLTGRLTCLNCGAAYHAHNDPPRVAGICDRCGRMLEVREDDHPDRIRTRFRLYKERTRPLIDYYGASNLLRTMNAVGTEDDVFARCLAAVESGT